MKILTFFRLFAAFKFVRNRDSLRNFLVTSELTRGFDSEFRISWSQGGEDLSILSLFPFAEMGNYIDIGCHHPSRYSNTRHLYQRGWRGVNVDADENLVRVFFSERLEDINICAAVGSETEYVLNVFDEQLVSTVDSSRVAYEISIGRKKVSERKIRGITLRSIIDKHFRDERVTVLLIDIEGSDYDALNSIDFDSLEPNSFPKYLVLETFPPLSRALSAPSVELAVSKGYIPIQVLPLSTILMAPDLA